MKSVLIFSTCLVLVLLLHGKPKTDIREFDVNVNLEQVGIEVSSWQTCFANNFIFGIDSINDERRNLTISSRIWPVTTNNYPQFSRLFYVPQMVGWAMWIGLSHRRRLPYRNPLRRFRLNKKQRRRDLSHLLTLLAQENDGSSSSVSGALRIREGFLSRFLRPAHPPSATDISHRQVTNVVTC